MACRHATIFTKSEYNTLCVNQVVQVFLGLQMTFGSNIIGYFSTVTYVSCNEDIFYILIGALMNNKIFTLLMSINILKQCGISICM